MIAECITSLGFSLTPDDVVRAVKNLPASPRVLPRLKFLLGDGNSSMHDIVALVRLDPAIAARVLQTANSAYFGGGVRYTTVGEAVNRATKFWRPSGSSMNRSLTTSALSASSNVWLFAHWWVDSLCTETTRSASRKTWHQNPSHVPSACALIAPL